MSLTSWVNLLFLKTGATTIFLSVPASNFPYLCSTAQTFVARLVILYTPTDPMALVVACATTLQSASRH